MAALWVLVYFSILIWSGIHPKDGLTWLLEVLPAMIAFVLLAATRRRFPFTSLAYFLILIHCLILMVGGHYTYAEVPLFDSLGDYFGWQRNNYDKLGHLAQGFVPAIVAREILLRNAVIASGKWVFFIVICICLAISALYELIEWGIALASGKAAEAFLGTQGYVWDTQSDMAYALIGAIIALVLLDRMHDRQIKNISEN
ncbi:uncharacterized protein UCP020606 [Sulfuricella denitrificans skB26]|uniref:Uncharacterized protein UCP020606 n=1 Tax=Sulfuricella denitrificans (strain DSM 22764 / NBRC 105220 / skB26) TaxID=1163617 RepID=S6A9F1_SULDS|nr:DUF2238 domain-containing protein [Sulfuricella denitrificans]BAN34000.1 uncharacterized protein UCP020606 [Sulfuricella denitrificans skB26]